MLEQQINCIVEQNLRKTCLLKKSLKTNSFAYEKIQKLVLNHYLTSWLLIYFHLFDYLQPKLKQSKYYQQKLNAFFSLNTSTQFSNILNFFFYQQNQIIIYLASSIFYQPFLLNLMSVDIVQNEQLKYENDFFKSLTLNPESRHISCSSQQQFDSFMTRRQSNYHRRKTHTNIKMKEALPLYSNCINSPAYFNPANTISSMIRNRHYIEQTTTKMTNFWRFLEHKYQKAHKKNSFLQNQSAERSRIVKTNKSEKQFFSKSIRKYNESTYERKLESKSVIANHRKRLHQKREKTKEEIKKVANNVRNQSAANQSQIIKSRLQWSEQKREAASKQKSIEEEYKRHKAERQSRKKAIAEENYRKRWIQEHLNQEKAQKIKNLRMKKIQPKIDKILQETQQLSLFEP